ncbi:glyoxalase, partial [Klebsiella oxytoca]|nr:glyoxalase [Klebsiella oxytoca]
MEYDLDGMDVLFVAGFGPITQSTPASREFYVAALGLPLKPMPGNEEYLLTEQHALD